VVPRRDADALVAALALRLPAGAVSLRRPRRREPRRSKTDPEYELIDTGVFDGNRYWEITVEYAKADTDDICARITVRNVGPDEATLTVLPTLWFRNTWSWGIDDRQAVDPRRAGLARGRSPRARNDGPHRSDAPTALFCENETNYERLFGVADTTPYPKDGINDHVVSGAATVNPAGTGTKAAFSYASPSGRERAARSVSGSRPRRERLDGLERGDRRAAGRGRRLLRDDHPEGRDRRRRDDRAPGLRRDDLVEAVLPLQRRALARRRPGRTDASGSPANGRNSQWRHLDNLDVISMPDPWEYPWYAAWDLAFHA
jgi:hypothetical protein